jgi:hypothetical protein
LASCTAIVPTAPRGTIDQRRLTRGELASPKEVESCRAAETECHGILIAQVLGNPGDRSLFVHGHVFGVPPKSNPRETTTLSPGWKPVTALPTASTCRGHLEAQDGLLWPGEAESQPHRQAQSAGGAQRPHPAVAGIDRRRKGPIQHSPSAGTGFGTSLICTNSGGPHLSQTAAFIITPSGAS